MRGLTGCQIDFHGPDVDLHSGSFGGAVPNPLTALAGLLAALHDEDGRVTIPGFYDAVVAADRRGAGPVRRAAVRREGLAGRPGQVAGRGRRGRLHHAGADRRPADRRGQRHVGRLHRPGPQDDRAQRRVREAVLPAGRRPARRPTSSRWCEQFVAEHTPPGITATVHWEGDGVAPLVTPLDSPALPALVRAMEQAFGAAGGFTREGGSGPGGRPGRDPRRAGGVPRRRAAGRRDPLAERAGRAADAGARRGGRGLPLDRARFTRVSPGPVVAWGP